MRVLLDTFWAPKRGNSLDEYEDAFSPDENGAVEGTRLRFAVADGATEASFSKQWARLLVQGYRKEWIRGGDVDMYEGLERLARIWRRSLKQKKLPWYAEEKMQRGAFAALLGLEVSASQDGEAGTWKAYSVGDCCLFHLDGERFLGSFPFDDPRDFGSRPILLSSVMERNGTAIASASSVSGVCKVGDIFYLMSDALAAWFLSAHWAERHPWRLACELGTDAAECGFHEWVRDRRAQDALRNDDVTLVRVALV